MRIVGMIPVYNEADVVGYVIEHLISQGIELAILDNGSTDGSYEICSSYVKKGVVRLEALPTEQFLFDLIVQKLYNMAASLKPDWVLLSAADEFLESPYLSVTLKEAIASEDLHGYNLIQFNNFEFFPTEKDPETELDVRRRLKYYTWNDDLQFRCWKLCPGVTVTGTAGHYPVFPKDVRCRIPHAKYVLRHYRIRSYSQGLRKVFEDRLPRYPPAEKQRGRHIHYDNFRPDRSYFVIHSDNLIKYNDDDRWVTKKTFDWTWGVEGKAWAHPPKSSLTVRVGNSFPFAVRMWKAMFLKKKRLDRS